MKNNILILILMISLIGIASAETSWGTYKQGDCINLSIVSDATTCTISSLKYPDSTNIISSITMTNLGNGEFTYNLCDTNNLGVYTAKGLCDTTPWSNDFEVTPSGNSGSSNIAFIIFVIIIIYGIGFFGFFGKNMTLSILGGLAMLGLGVYMINQGIIIYRDDITLILSWTTIGVGAVFALVPIVEWLEDNF